MRGRLSTARVRAGSFAACVLALVALAGCATRRPVAPAPPETLLLTGYSTWFAADVEGNRDLLRSVLGDLGAEIEVVDRTQRIVGGVRFASGTPGAPVDIAAVASGRFPPGGTRFVLGADRSFARRVARVDNRRLVYYQEREGALQLALPARDLLYLSSGRILELLAERPPAELELDPGLYRMLRSVGLPGEPTALVVFDDPGRTILTTLGVEAPVIALARMALSLDAVEAERVLLGASFHFRSERDAALFSRIGRLFVVVFVRSLGIEGAVAQQARITVDGTVVGFTGIPLGRDEIAPLIRRFQGGA